MDDDTSRYPVPDGLNFSPHSRCDTPSDFEQAVRFSATMGDSRLSYLWQRAVEIGFRAAGGYDEGVKDGCTSGLRNGKKEGRKAGKTQGLNEGEIIGFERGVSEGKRLGFVAGREFGEKQAAKLSKPPASRILVDTGTDSPPAVLSPPPAPLTVTYSSAFMQTDAQCDTTLPILGVAPAFVWADEPSDVHIPEQTTFPPPLPPHDLSALRSDWTTSTPFASLRYRAHRTQKTPRDRYLSTTGARFSMRPQAMRGSVPPFVRKTHHP
ncbi:hypothetical protein C8R43DRAFT_1124117 [Mycena crocata]|nr:hypothetical protein C8R43DRAFT_947866 [Mycena crocata]KAJ7160658.1 hypothetical protein C8R43DRAFT_1124117 [Mycena crocata]